jgi:carbamate kinase
MGKRIVIALGGNALGNNLTEQMTASKSTAKAIADLIIAGNEVIISHGNGPQVGMIQNAMSELVRSDPRYPVIPLSVCVAMSQSYIGYDLQNALREELLNRNYPKDVASIITQTIVDPADPAFKNPTKPIGRFMTRDEADALVSLKGYTMVEDAGRGWRRVVPSPQPQEIVEIGIIRSLADAGKVVICCGGGGIPVIREAHNHLHGASAVIDKDYGSELLAEQLDADYLVILTAVEKVAVNFNKAEQKWLDHLTVSEAQEYCDEGQFAPGSMLPKIRAGIRFAQSKAGRSALITLLEKAKDGLEGKTGTVITADPQIPGEDR